MKHLFLGMLLLTGCSRTLDGNVGTEVYPHDPMVLQKITLGASLRTQW